MIKHLACGQALDLNSLPEKSRTLFKQDDVQVLWLFLESGRQVDPHHIGCWVLIECIRGRFEIELFDRSIALPAGSLILLEPSQPHAVFCTLRGAILVTLFGLQSMAEI